MNTENNNGAIGGVTEENNPPCAPSDMDTGLCGPLSLAMAYVPKQYWRALYGEHEGMHAGTLFRELDKPFLGEKMGDQNAKR